MMPRFLAWDWVASDDSCCGGWVRRWKLCGSRMSIRQPSTDIH